MRPPVPTIGNVTAVMTPGVRILVCGWMVVTVSGVAIVRAERPEGSIIGWGRQVVGVDLSAGFSAIAAGSYHTLGLKTNGSIVAWGWNAFAQTNVPFPNTGFVSIAAGYEHSLGLKLDGSIVAWGSNDLGQLDVPASNSAFVAVAAGDFWSLGLKADGSVFAWGLSNFGQTNVPFPNTGFVAIAAGIGHALGLKTDGSIVAWGCAGLSNYGQCNVPFPNNSFVGIAAGDHFSIGLKADGSIVAWGYNEYGATNLPVPNSGFVAVAAGNYHSMGLKDDGSIVTWGCGDFDFGQCNVPSPNTSFIAVAAGTEHSVGLKADGAIVIWGCNRAEGDSGDCNAPHPNIGFVGVTAGAVHSLGLQNNTSVTAWGSNVSGQTTVPAPNSDFVSVAAGGWHNLGLKANGSIVAWGSNSNGQSNPTPGGNSGFVGMAAGFLHSLGLKADGSIVGWGSNDYGQTNVPPPNTGFIAVAAGGYHSLGLKPDGSVVAWGSNSNGQRNIPSPNTGFVGVAAGLYHSLGLKSDGSIVTWGYNGYGLPVVPVPNTGFTGIAAGWFHSLGLKTDGTIVAWGRNDLGQTNVPYPNGRFLAVAAGGDQSLAIRAFLTNDNCGGVLPVGEGTQVFTTVGATTDQPAETCVYRFGSDLWYQFSSPRTGEATISLCGSDYDTALAVYKGLSCPPTEEPLACNDDSFCGSEYTSQSNVSFPAYRGTEYLIRVGGYNRAQGNGQMNINVEGAGCGDSNAGSCCSAHEGTGCSAFDCCQAVCACDPYCCDTEWDDLCASETNGENGCDAALAPCGPKLVVAPSSRNVPAGAGTTNFAVSNSRCGSMNWTASVVQGSSWLWISSVESGTNGGIVWVSHSVNSTPTSRTGTVRVTPPGATPSYVDVTVVQAGNVSQPSVDRFFFSDITSPQTTGASFEVTISARRVDKSLDTSFNSEVQLSATSSANVTPSRARLSGGTWTGQLSVDRPYAQTRLRAYWNPVEGESEEFSVTTDKGSGNGSVAGFVSEHGGGGDGAEVILLPADGQNPRSVFTPETCPPEQLANLCQFRFSSVPAGRYYVSARKGGLRSTVEEIRVQERFPTSVTLHLRDAPPVVFVPGFPASGMKGSPIPMFSGSPGSLPPSELELIDVPLFHSIWGDLRSLLGYYFQVIDAPWDWRDPIDKATIDKYLVPAILKARGCSDVNRSDCRWAKIDVVAHSYGGILSRAYIESEEYGRWNEIDHFAMLGTPNEGAAIIYYLWQGADSRKADQVAYKWSVTMPVNLYIYTNVLNANFFLAKGFPAFVGVTPLPGGILPLCTSLGPCVRTAKHEDIFDFIRDFIPGGGDILMVSEFLDRNGARFAPSDATPGLIADLAANPTRNRMTRENGDSSLVRTKLFLSDSADHKAVESIVVGPPNPSGKFYRDGTPIGSPRKAAGDGTVLAYPLERVGLSSISVDRTRAAEHSDLMNEYGDEVCRFLRNGEACVPTVTAEEEAPARILNISLVGRAQPYIVAPDGAGATGTPPGSEDIEVGITGSTYNVGIEAAGVTLRDPTDGVYQVRVSGLDGEIFTVNMVYATDQSQEQVVFRGVGREAPHSFDLRLSAGESPILQPDYVVEPPTDIRALRIGETTRVTWNPSPDGQVVVYDIYGRTDDVPQFTLLGTTSGTSFDPGHPWKTNEDDVLWTYFVVAVTAEGLESFFTEQVENRTPLVAAFSAAPPVGPRPLTTTFYDESAGEVSAWAWDFDSDGAVDSTDQSPSFTFEQPGLYSVTLTVGGPSGTDTTVEVAYVRVDALGDVDRNDRVDLADYAVFADAMLGPEVDPDTAPDVDPKARAGWRDFDFEFDRDVDLRDLAEFQTLFTLPPP